VIVPLEKGGGEGKSYLSQKKGELLRRPDEVDDHTVPDIAGKRKKGKGGEGVIDKKE